eukprot:COSAG06_NODE_5872_length_3234_cov_3.348006_4_plen_122_part_00
MFAPLNTTLSEGAPLAPAGRVGAASAMGVRAVRASLPPPPPTCSSASSDNQQPTTWQGAVAAGAEAAEEDCMLQDIMTCCGCGCGCGGGGGGGVTRTTHSVAAVASFPKEKSTSRWPLPFD